MSKRNDYGSNGKTGGVNGNGGDDLIKRYIYAVIRYLPQKTQADVEKELEGLISDMLEERRPNAAPSEADIKAVLAELGAPAELAAKYSGDENQSLISGTYYLLYKRVLKIFLPVIAVVVAFAGVLATVLEWSAHLDQNIRFDSLIGLGLGGIAGGAFQAFAIITLVFAVMSYKKAPIEKLDFLSSLPQIPGKNAKIRPHKPVIGILWSVVGVVILLFVPQVLGGWVEGVGWIPVFTISVIRGCWPFIALWAVLSVAKETMAMIEGQYTARLAVVTIISDLLILACISVVLMQNNIMNPDFVNNIGAFLVGDGARFLSGYFIHANLLLLGIVAFATLIEMITVVIKAWSNRDN